VDQFQENEVFISLLREWWRLACENIEKTMGLENAIQAFMPYCRNMGVSGSQNLRKAASLQTDTLAKLAVYEIYMSNAISGEGEFHSFIGPNSGYGYRIGCVHEGRSRLQCITACEITAGINVETMNPEYRVELKEAMYQGCGRCLWRYSRKGHEFDVSGFRDNPIPKLDPEMVDLFATAIAGEFWADLTKSFCDAIGAQEAMKVMLPSVRGSGRSYAEMRGKESRKRGEPLLFESQIDDLNRLTRRKSVSIWNPRGGEGEVSECPFSGSSPEICQQFEAFFNGVCDAISPGSEFHYDKMMTRGDPVCHWSVKRNSKALETSSDGLLSDGDGTALELLKKRLVMGELTPEQYSTLRDILLEK
jgi:hypothetical protein